MSIQLCWFYQPRGWAHSDFRREVCEMEHYQLDWARGAAVGKDLFSVRRDCLLALMPPPHLHTANAAAKKNYWYRDVAALFNHKCSEQLGILGMHFRLPALHFGWITAIGLCALVFLSFAITISIFFSPTQIAGKRVSETDAWLGQHTACDTEQSWPTVNKAGASFLSNSLQYRRLWKRMSC